LVFDIRFASDRFTPVQVSQFSGTTVLGADHERNLKTNANNRRFPRRVFRPDAGGGLAVLVCDNSDVLGWSTGTISRPNRQISVVFPEKRGYISNKIMIGLLIEAVAMMSKENLKIKTIKIELLEGIPSGSRRAEFTTQLIRVLVKHLLK